MKPLLGISVVGGIFRTLWVGTTFVRAVCAKAIVGNAKAQDTASIIPFIGELLKVVTSHAILGAPQLSATLSLGLSPTQ
jgi:hypothetical protein